MYSAFRNVLCPLNKWHSMASTEPLKLAAKNGEPKGGFGANFPFQLSRESAKERKLKIIKKPLHWEQLTIDLIIGNGSDVET